MNVGDVIRQAREQVGLSQGELARRAGTSQSAVAGYETGSRIPSSRMLDRLLGPCGYSARSRLHPRHFDMDRALDEALAKTPAERLWLWSPILEHMATLNTPVVIVGAAALAAHGVPIPVDALELAFGSEPQEVAAAIQLLEKLYARYYPTCYDDPVPSRPAVETVTVWVATLGDVEPPAEDADLVRPYLERLVAQSKSSW